MAMSGGMDGCLLLSLLLLIVEVEVFQEVTVLGTSDHTDVITQQLLLQELLGQILHTHHTTNTSVGWSGRKGMGWMGRRFNSSRVGML